MKYLLDEYVPLKFRRALLEKVEDLDVWRIGDEGSPPRQTPDPEILVWCEANDFMLVTNNRQSMPVHLAEHLGDGQARSGYPDD